MLTLLLKMKSKSKSCHDVNVTDITVINVAEIWVYIM